MERAPLWIFGDQLGPQFHSLDEHRGREVVLVESERVFRLRRFHRQKLRLVLWGLRHTAAELGDRAIHLRTGTYREALERVGRPVVVHEPTSLRRPDGRGRTGGREVELRRQALQLLSDHCKGCAFDPKKRLGDDARPFTAGYWAWTHRHRDLLAANHRTARAVRA